MKHPVRKCRPATKNDWKCPIHGTEVKVRKRFKQDKETGKYNFSGTYYACPNYSECFYYVSGNMMVPILEEENDAKDIRICSTGE